MTKPRRIRWEFEHQGQRYTGSAGSKREANAAKKARRAEVLAGENKSREPRGSLPNRSRITLAAACQLYWEARGHHNRSASDIERRLGIVQRLLGAGTDIAAIRFADIDRAIQARRAEPGRAGQPLKPASVNRDVRDALRPVLKHAARIHELALPEIAWAELGLKEAGELVREFSAQEIEAWAAELGGPAERLFLATALTYAPRLGELFFPPAALKLDAPDGPELELGRYLGRGGIWRESRKDGSLHVIALLEADAAALGAQAALAAKAAGEGARHIWVDESGQAISYYAMRGRLVRAAARAGIAPGRIIHGMRHHGVTAIVRRAGLVLGQQLAGHRQITTTRRYAHASKADMRAALERPSEGQRPAKTPQKAPPLTR